MNTQRTSRITITFDADKFDTETALIYATSAVRHCKEKKGLLVWKNGVHTWFRPTTNPLNTNIQIDTK